MATPNRHPLQLPAAVAGALVLFVALFAGGEIYTLLGGGEKLVLQMMINAIIVVGMQIYIGNTGVLSFGHIGFGGIAGYTFAVLAISADRKATTIRNAPFGLSDVELSPWLAGLIAVAVCLLIAALVGLGLARSGAQSGAVAATVITLALLFMVHEVAVNWDALTGGDRAGLTFSIGDTLPNRWPVVGFLLLSLVVARVFAVSSTGRQAQAAREDDLAARAMGINPTVHQMAALLVSVALVAIGACLRTYDLGSITPRFFFFDFTLLTLTMLIVGGRNSVTGSVLGVAVITVGNEFTRYLAGPSVDVAKFILRPGLTDIFLGGSMLGFMILRPNGLLDDWEIDHPWFSRRRRAGESTPVDAGDPKVASRAVLRVEQATVDFGGFRALREASIVADGHDIVGIIGPNGAGKTTLLNVVTGMVAPTSGSVWIDDTDLSGVESYRIARSGVVRTFQNLRLFGALTVRENVEVVAIAAGRHRNDRDAPDTDLLLARSGLWDLRDRRASELDYGNARRLELARAAAARPDFLLLDEPTSGMSDTESISMIEQVRSMAGAVGAGVIVIDHDLGFITGICDRIYCLDQGSVIAEGTPEEIKAHPHVRAAYLGLPTIG